MLVVEHLHVGHAAVEVDGYVEQLPADPVRGTPVNAVDTVPLTRHRFREFLRGEGQHGKEMSDGQTREGTTGVRWQVVEGTR